eukprot:jgi/Mesvir1/10542/Mv21774-RA.2
MAAKTMSEPTRLKKAKAPLKVTTFAWDEADGKQDAAHGSPQFPSRSRQIGISLAQASLRRDKMRSSTKESTSPTDVPPAYNPGAYGSAERVVGAPPPPPAAVRAPPPPPLSREEQLQMAALEAEVSALRQKAAELKAAQQASARAAPEPRHASAALTHEGVGRAPARVMGAVVAASPHGEARRRPLTEGTALATGSPRQGGENLPSSYVRFLEKRLQLLAEDLGGFAALDGGQGGGEAGATRAGRGSARDGGVEARGARRSSADGGEEDDGRAGSGVAGHLRGAAPRAGVSPAAAPVASRKVAWREGGGDDDAAGGDDKENNQRGDDTWHGGRGDVSGMPAWPYSSRSDATRFNMGLAEYERATGMVRSASACDLRWENTMFGKREAVGEKQGRGDQGAGSDPEADVDSYDGDGDGGDDRAYGYVSDSAAGWAGTAAGHRTHASRPHSAVGDRAHGAMGVGGPDGSGDTSQPTRTSDSSYSYLTAGHHWFGGHHGQCARRLSRPKKPTVPRSFSFEAREGQRKKTIAQMRLDQDLALLRERERRELHHTFTANALPASALEPRYEQMVEEEATRRQMRKHARREMLEAFAQPFSLYYRSTAASYHELLQLQEERKALRQLRAREALQGIQLPPAVERLAAEGKAAAVHKAMPPVLLQPNCTFAPKVNKMVPDFKKLHRAWEDSLTTSRGAAHRTVFREFSLETEKIDAAERQRRIQQDMNADAQMLPEERWPFMSTRAKVRPAAVPSFPAPAKPVRETRASRGARIATQQGFQKGAFLTRAQKEEIANQKLEKARQVRRKLWEVAKLQHAKRNEGADPMADAGGDAASGISKEIAPQLHVQARHQQQEERAREMVEQALLANNVPLDVILGDQE